MLRAGGKSSSTKATRHGARSRCKLCNNLSPRGHTSSSYDADSATKHNANLTLCIDARQLSASNCQYCKLLRQSLQGFVGRDWAHIRDPVCIDLLEGSPIKVSVQEPSGKSIVFELYTPSDQRPPWPALGNARSIPISSGSDESFDFARKCIKDCMSSPAHGACRKSTPSRLPSRLIDVQGGKNLKLVELKGKDVEYITLSYCWGPGSAVTTTSANLRNMRKGIDWDTLPVLFQDAVTITRRLDIRYLWIDGLCIIQDDKKDWESESSKMSDIYEASYITIAADACEDNTHPCLVQRPKRLRLEHRTARGKTFTVKARKVSNHHETSDGDLAFRTEGPLRDRAWALQENVLSPRILHYTETELTFECRSTYRCECNPLSRRKATTPGLLPKLLLSVKQRSKIFRTWHRILAQYTLRKLTVASDKLPAISGIAKKVQTATDSVYVAGLWKDNLVEDLLWASAPHLESPHFARRLDDYRAPSFSWASVDTQIQPLGLEEDEAVELSAHISITKTSCTKFGLNPLGEVTDGFIDLCGPLAEGTLVAPESYKFEYHLAMPGSGTAVGVSPDSLLVQDLTEDDSSGGMVRRGKQEESYKPFKARVWCLSVAGHSHGCVSGLVLTKSSRVPGAYERIGHFTCGNDWLVGAKKQKIKIV
ncbi:hypothetical protein Z517_08455 [Fonsecaea pedrosoi CBS 271.37]|uniref:Heterokaryon incompatibility domain-containing protein n=1 Tax=Fonsecaea pedrosoi CBS 271.37 TaxID=1442368 RepID=A0A0D2EWP9_9EURO|nr:uncharacterized protein Z517_08455 [Fonsecaea pedrosoi CBS 271.37]KIW78617.1 hypothetical protein Z517_08455 [Fonsecaea pedrosoi CBS 271.37]